MWKWIIKELLQDLKLVPQSKVYTFARTTEQWEVGFSVKQSPPCTQSTFSQRHSSANELFQNLKEPAASGDKITIQHPLEHPYQCYNPSHSLLNLQRFQRNTKGRIFCSCLRYPNLNLKTCKKFNSNEESFQLSFLSKK